MLDLPDLAVELDAVELVDIAVDGVVEGAGDTVTILSAKGSSTVIGLTDAVAVWLGPAAYTAELVVASTMDNTTTASTTFLHGFISLLFMVTIPPFLLGTF